MELDDARPDSPPRRSTGYIVRKDLVRKLQGPVPGADLRRRVPARPLLRQHRRGGDRGGARDRRAPAARPDRPRRRGGAVQGPRPRDAARSSSSTSSPPASTPRPTRTSPTLPSLQLKDVRIDDDAGPRQRADADRRLLRRGRPRLRRRDRPGDERPAVRRSTRLRPIQLSKRDVLDDARRGPRSVHDRASGSTSCSAASAWSRRSSRPRAQDVLLLRMVPFVERNYNMVELGPRGTGK